MSPNKQHDGDGRWGVTVSTWWLLSIASSSTHFSATLVWSSPQAAVLQEKIHSSADCPQATVPSGNIHLLRSGDLSSCSVDICSSTCSTITSSLLSLFLPLRPWCPLYNFSLLFSSPLPVQSFCPFLNVFYQKLQKLCWRAQLCPAVGLLELVEISCVQHGAVPAVPLLPTPLHLHPILIQRKKNFNVYQPPSDNATKYLNIRGWNKF